MDDSPASLCAYVYKRKERRPAFAKRQYKQISGSFTKWEGAWSMREKLIRFMQGRYGSDSLSRALLGVTFVLVLVNMFVRIPVLSLVVVGLIVYVYFRTFSRNISKRYAENQAFLRLFGGWSRFFKKEINLMKQRKTHHIYRCPGCRQKIRVPKGKGKICIRCPKCKTEFIKKS